MHARNNALGLITLAGLATGAYLLLDGPESNEATVAPARIEPERSPDRERDLAPALKPAEAGPVERSPAVPPTAIEHASEPEPNEAISFKGLVVAGSVSFADDGTPAAEASFVLHHPAGHVVVDADDRGHFRTEPVVAPGVADLYHRPTDAGGSYPLRMRFAPASISLQGEPGEEVQVELALERPEEQLLVRVVHRDGRDAPGARVELDARYEVRPEEYEYHVTPSETDEGGLARFGLFDLENMRTAGLIAHLDRTQEDRSVLRLVSPHLDLEVPLLREELATPFVLVLDAAGSLLVRLHDERGAPVPHERVWLSPRDMFSSGLVGEPQDTDDAGEALFDGLPPGTYLVSHISDPGLSAPTAEVWAAQLTELDVVVATHDKRLAVAGRVVDEEGEPIAGVQIKALYGPRDTPGDTSASAVTDDAGRFELRTSPCYGVTVHSNRDVFGDEFDPAYVEVPFGTTDVLFRRVRTVERERIGFEIVDAVTGERLPSALIMTYRAPHTDEYSFHRAEEGLASPLCALHPGTTLVVELAGYRRRTLNLDELLAQQPVDGLRRVALDRGLLRVVHVEGFDSAGEQAPVAGARIRLGERGLGSTDAEGNLLLDLYTWPEITLTIEAEGFLPTTWGPAEGFSEVDPAFIWLERQ